jgi:hypothetical protein
MTQSGQKTGRRHPVGKQERGDGTQLPFRAFVWGAVESKQPPGGLELPP